jgi:hypothetical protein
MTRTITILLALVLSAPAFSQQYEKNNLPCVAEICIGDGLAELATVKWDKAKRPSPMPTPQYVDTIPLKPEDLAVVQKVFPGAGRPVAAYLRIEAFDQKAIPLLKDVKAACRQSELTGTFTSSGGNPTTVKVALLPDKTDTSLQRWAVTSIFRTFPDARSQTQQADIRKQLDERYGHFTFRRQRDVNAMYTVNRDPFMSGRYGFALSMIEDLKDQERYRLHPACGGANKVSID